MRRIKYTYNTSEPSGGLLGAFSPVGFFYAINFQILISSVQPKTTKLDFIEAKTTMGGRQISLSIIQIPLFHKLTSICAAKTATYDLTQPWNNAAKHIYRSINITVKTTVKGLIELMY